MKEKIDNKTKFSTLEFEELIDCFLYAKGGDALSVFSMQLNQEYVLLNGELKEQVISFDALSPSMELKRSIYLLLSRTWGIELPWGILTGVRPQKLINRLLREKGEKQARELLHEVYLVSFDKIDLGIAIGKLQRPYTASFSPGYSLYVHIPFCPSRCRYCSFLSYPMEKYGKYMDAYLDVLLQEIDQIRSLYSDADCETVYIGGGTPTSLDSKQLERLLSTLQKFYPNVKERTLEAGRPDTITRKKLEIASENGVNRISINPQSFKEDTLRRIGRNHTIKEVLDAYEWAREYNFFVNMDLILGLPEETEQDFAKSLNRAIELSPENITVHGFSLKTKSAYFQEGIHQANAMDYMKVTKDMLSALEGEGYTPYYLYRQKRTVGNLENIGFERNQTPSLYNIYMMEENQTILGCGAGAVSKIFTSDNKKHVRLANTSSLKLYMEDRERQKNKYNKIRKLRML